MAEGKAEFVWYPAGDSENWLLCQLLKRTPDGGATLKRLKPPAAEFEVSSENAKLICPRPGPAAQNLTKLTLDGLGPGTVEDAIRNQFCNQLPYTNIDDITLCVNPFRELSIYSDTWVDKYSQLDPSLPPHIYNASALAYSRVMDKKQNQILQLVGDPCSGKSRAFEHILCFLGQTAGDGDEELKQLLGALRPLLSVQCMCGKDRTWLSTRALLEVDLGLGPDGFICRTAASVELLEAGRLLRPEGAEGNSFDALYLAATAKGAAEWLGKATEFRLLGEEADLEEYDEDGVRARDWLEALSAFGIEGSEVVRVLCALLLLGQVSFTGETFASCESAGAVKAAATALGVDSEQLQGALSGEGGAADASCSLDAALEDLYRRLVAWVLDRANAHLDGDSKAAGSSIKVREVPSRPGELDAPGGLDGLVLQWLTEAVFAHIINVTSQASTSNIEDASHQQALAKDALQAISGTDGLVSLFRNGGTKSELIEQVKDWAKTAAAKTGAVSLCDGGEAVAVEGACGQVKHPFHSFKHVRLGLNAAGARLPRKLLDVLAKSSCSCLAELASASFLRPASGVGAAEKAIAAVAGDFRRPGSSFEPWLVCCLRPNDKGLADMVSKPLLLQQVKKLRLADAVHLSAGSSYSSILPLDAFRARYSELASSLGNSTSDEEACRLLVKSAGGGEGTVGSDNVYGGVILQKLMDTQVQERAAGYDELKGTKEEMKQLMETKVEQLQQTHAMQNEQLQQKQQRHSIMQQVLRDQQQNSSHQQQKLLQQLQEQQADMRQQQQDELDKLRQQQQEELEILRKQQADAAGLAQSAILEATAAARQAALNTESIASLSRDPSRSPRPEPRSVRIAIPKESVPRFDAAMDITLEEEPRRSYPELHAALAQMAAILRVAKDRNQRFHELQESHEQSVQDLRDECGFWQQEAACLSSQAAALREQQERRSPRRDPSAAGLRVPPTSDSKA